MKPQITAHLCLPSYMRVNLLPDGFMVKVTRQIPNDEEAFNYFKALPESPDSNITEVYHFNGKNYITCRAFFDKNEGLYLNDPKVICVANDMHKYIMYHITNYKIIQLENKLKSYSEF